MTDFAPQETKYNSNNRIEKRWFNNNLDILYTCVRVYINIYTLYIYIYI